MNAPKDKFSTRRSFLRTGLSLAIAGALPVVWSHEAHAAKASKASMSYRNSPHDGHDCSKCMFFQPGSSPSAAGTCTVVAGSISPHGYCIAFSPKA